jgi:hypothetical protein
VDVDSSICETYGLLKQGARFGYTGVRGYHPLIASVAGTSEVVGVRLRGGNAHSGFYNHKVTAACDKSQVSYSITAKLYKGLHDLVAAIDKEAWVPIPYWIGEGADVAEIGYRPFSKQHPEVRLIVRRVKPTPGSQLALFATYSYHAFVTNREGDMIGLEADHRRHAVVEDVVRELKYGVGLNHLPSGRFSANAAWMLLNVLAHNLARWVPRIGLGSDAQSMNTKTLRTRLICFPGHMTTSARRKTLHLPKNGRGRSRSSRCSPTCVPPAARAPACVSENRFTTASRSLAGARRRQQPREPCLNARPLWFPRRFQNR